ncbi:MAG: hypothetical protein IT355_13035 [Gemmatimonadaceae bacterium]|nr:hypothetical protein [Gemmatimonadaceae bacterium]
MPRFRLSRSLPVLLGLLGACRPAAEGETPPVRRGNDPIAVALVAPIGYVKENERLITWHASPGVSRYEVVVSDSVEVPVFTSVTRDTQVTIPEGFRYSLSQNYRWYVTAYRDRDSTAWRSPVAVFRLEGEGRRMPPLPQP